MALEFHKLTGQIEKMIIYLAEQEEDIESKVEIAYRIMEAYSDEAFLPDIQARVQDAIDKDAGYRGARPIDEPIMISYPPAALPLSATIVATDGSQIFPRRHVAAQYYLLNIGTIVLHHGSGEPPQVFSQPSLFYDKEYMRVGGQGGQIGATTINARRQVEEMATLAEQALYQRGEARPLLTLLDGPLLFVMGNEIPERDQLRGLYFSAMNHLLDFKAGLAGYTDKPDSTFLIRMLHLLDLPEQEVGRRTLSTSGRIEGVRDAQLFRLRRESGEWLLPAGHRTALFVQMSPQNKRFRQEGGQALEIAFFYMNVAAPGELPGIARVEVPMWVAEDRELVAEMQALIYQQCQQITKHYPYVLMRADELAVVRGDEQQQLDTMIKVSMSRLGLDTLDSAKQASKDIARAHKSSFEI